MTTALACPIRRLPAPDREPPYDDELVSSQRSRAAMRPLATWPSQRRSNGLTSTEGAIVQGTLALAFVLPSGLPAIPQAPAGMRLVEPQREIDISADGVAAEDVDPDGFDELEFGPQPTPRVDLPNPRPWAGRLAQAVVEVLAGERPVTQLVRWTTRAVYDDVAERALRNVGGSARSIVRSVHLTEPADGVAEVAALVWRGARCFALALRLEGLDGRWQCSAIELG